MDGDQATIETRDGTLTTDEEDRLAEVEMLNRCGRRRYLPSADEIAAACAEIQAGWSDEDHYVRRRGWRKE